MRAQRRATPYAAGALALWRQAKTVAGALRNGRAILQSAKTDFITTAKPVKYDNEFAQSVVRVGAGAAAVAERRAVRMCMHAKAGELRHACSCRPCIAS